VLAISILAGAALALLARFGPDQTGTIETLIVGGVMFFCFLIPFTVIFFHHKKRSEEED